MENVGHSSGGKTQNPSKKSKKRASTATEGITKIKRPKKSAKWEIEWDYDTVRSLCNWYETYPYLWKKSHPDHLNRDKKISCIKAWISSQPQIKKTDQNGQNR
jgi:hypothetical protein